MNAATPINESVSKEEDVAIDEVYVLTSRGWALSRNDGAFRRIRKIPGNVLAEQKSFYGSSRGAIAWDGAIALKLPDSEYMAEEADKALLPEVTLEVKQRRSDRNKMDKDDAIMMATVVGLGTFFIGLALGAASEANSVVVLKEA